MSCVIKSGQALSRWLKYIDGCKSHRETSNELNLNGKIQFLRFSLPFPKKEVRSSMFDGEMKLHDFSVFASKRQAARQEKKETVMKQIEQRRMRRKSQT